jgi:hypothetical protein
VRLPVVGPLHVDEQSEGMPQDLACSTPSAAALAAIDSASLQLQRVAERLFDVGVLARRLSASTDWQSASARVFFTVSGRLADDAVGLSSLARAVLADVAFARVRVSVENSWDCR